MIDSALFMITGAALYGGTHHLYQGIHNRAGHPHVIHAGMFFLLAGFGFSSAATVSSIVQLAQLSKLSVSLGILLFATLPWFVARLVQQRSRLMPALLTGTWSILLLVNIASPYSLLYKDVTTANPVWHLVEITMVGTLIFSVYLCLQHYQRPRGNIAIAPVAGLWVLLCTTLFDIFVHAGLIQSGYLAPTGFMLFLIAAGLHRQSEARENRQSIPQDSSRYQVTLNFSQAPLNKPQTMSASVATETAPESPPPALQQDTAGVPVAPPPRIDIPAVDLVSDGLVDIAVHATLILKRLEQGECNAPELRELGYKVRSQAIETRRITHQMVREQQSAHKAERD